MTPEHTHFVMWTIPPVFTTSFQYTNGPVTVLAPSNTKAPELSTDHRRRRLLNGTPSLDASSLARPGWRDVSSLARPGWNVSSWARLTWSVWTTIQITIYCSEICTVIVSK